MSSSAAHIVGPTERGRSSKPAPLALIEDETVIRGKEHLSIA